MRDSRFDSISELGLNWKDFTLNGLPVVNKLPEVVEVFAEYDDDEEEVKNPALLPQSIVSEKPNILDIPVKVVQQPTVTQTAQLHNALSAVSKTKMADELKHMTSKRPDISWTIFEDVEKIRKYLYVKEGISIEVAYTEVMALGISTSGGHRLIVFDKEYGTMLAIPAKDWVGILIKTDAINT